MDEAEVYLEIADDAIRAAEAALDTGCQSKGTFLGYHAFESIGGAYCRRKGIAYPDGHNAKLNAFVHHVRLEGCATHVANLAVSYKSIGRNALMYPTVLAHGVIKRPSEVVSLAQAKRLEGRTASLVKRLRTDM